MFKQSEDRKKKTFELFVNNKWVSPRLALLTTWKKFQQSKEDNKNTILLLKRNARPIESRPDTHKSIKNPGGQMIRLWNIENLVAPWTGFGTNDRLEIQRPANRVTNAAPMIALDFIRMKYPGSAQYRWS